MFHLWKQVKNNKRYLNIMEKVTFIVRILFALLFFWFLAAFIYSAYKI